MSESSGVNLLLASLDLGVVQMLRGAMQAADLGAAAALGGAGGAGSGTIGPAAVFTPTPKYEPRMVYQPTPQFAPRPVVHPEQRVADERVGRIALQVAPPIAPMHISPSPIVPVWKTLPHIPPPSAVPPVKIQIVRPDIRTKGSLIDTVI